MSALIAACDLVCATHLRKDTDVHMFHISTSDGKRHYVLGFTCSRARVAANAPCVINDLGPLYGCWILSHFGVGQLYHLVKKRELICKNRPLMLTKRRLASEISCEVRFISLSPLGGP
jgi:hypothetical protein